MHLGLFNTIPPRFDLGATLHVWLCKDRYQEIDQQAYFPPIDPKGFIAKRATVLRPIPSWFCIEFYIESTCVTKNITMSKPKLDYATYLSCFARMSQHSSIEQVSYSVLKLQVQLIMNRSLRHASFQYVQLPVISIDVLDCID